MINLDLKNIEMIPASSAGGGEYDDTQIKADIATLILSKADKTELEKYALKANIPDVSNEIEASNIKAGDNIAISTSGNNITISASSSSSGGGNTDYAGIRTLHYTFSRAHGSKPLFVANDYSNLKAGDIYIVKIDWGSISYPNEVANNLFFPNIDFNFTEFNFISQQGQGFVKSYLCILECEGGQRDQLNIGYCNETDYEPTNATLIPLL